MLATCQNSGPTGSSATGVAVVPYTSAEKAAVPLKVELEETWIRYFTANGTASQVKVGLPVSAAPAAGLVNVGAASVSAPAAGANPIADASSATATAETPSRSRKLLGSQW